MKVLAIESSCDETAAAIVEDYNILSESIASQIAIHSHFGGVVPEIASREHLKKINKVIEHCLRDAELNFDDIDAFAVTAYPGLEGSLLVGKTAARTISYLKNKKLLEIDHLEAHLFAAKFSDVPATPGICLLISGGHTRIIHVKEWGVYDLLGETRDDAVGECFDKVASILDLPYPGGPSIEKTAQEGNENIYQFPVSKLQNPYEFSYSGIKTAVLYKIRYDKKGELTAVDRADIAASFQNAAFKPLINNTIKAALSKNVKWIFVCGGVAANGKLREKFFEAASKKKLKVIFPEKRHCTDNASMVAACALFYMTSQQICQRRYC